MKMQRAQLIPKHEAPPSSLKSEPPYKWRRGLTGAAIGVAVSVLAHVLDASPWWWLSVAVGLAAGITPQLEPYVLWGRK
jgi:hypothetical protein